MRRLSPAVFSAPARTESKRSLTLSPSLAHSWPLQASRRAAENLRWFSAVWIGWQSSSPQCLPWERGRIQFFASRSVLRRVLALYYVPQVPTEECSLSTDVLSVLGTKKNSRATRRTYPNQGTLRAVFLNTLSYRPCQHWPVVAFEHNGFGSQWIPVVETKVACLASPVILSPVCLHPFVTMFCEELNRVA